MSLQRMFLESRGHPIKLDGKNIIQMNSYLLKEAKRILVRFVGKKHYVDNAIVLTIKRPGYIIDSDGTKVQTVIIWDEGNSNRQSYYIVEPMGERLDVYNKYRVVHKSGLVTEDSFTGDSGMVVTCVKNNLKRYECSNSLGGFDLHDLVFEIEISNTDR